MRRGGLIEGLETRQHLTAVDTARGGIDRIGSEGLKAGDFTAYLTGVNPDGTLGTIDTSDEAIARDKLIVIRYGNGGGGAMIAGSVFHGSRSGSFTLPTIKADGSSYVPGSPGDDVITIEAVTGYLDADTENRDADGAFDFVNLVDPTTGERYVASGPMSTDFDGQIRGAKFNIQGEEYYLAAMKNTAEYNDDEAKRAEVVAEIEARIEELYAQIARAEVAKKVASEGRFIKYTLEGVYEYYVQVVDGRPAIPRVTVDAGAGSDTIKIGSNVPMKATVYGGSGGDTITTGKLQANVFGGGGKDKLINRSSKGAFFDGGQAADKYYNRSDADIQVNGRDDGDLAFFASGTVPVTKMVMVGKDPERAGYWSVREISRNEDGSITLQVLNYIPPAP